MINKYHVGIVTYFLEKLKKMQDGDASLLDRTMVVYGSPMGDSNVHNHRRVPFFVAGKANGVLKGHDHIIAPDATPTANVYLTLLHRLGINVESFGDSTGEFSI